MKVTQCLLYVVRNKGDHKVDNRFVWKDFLFVGIEDMKEDCFAQFYAFVDINWIHEGTWNINGLLMIQTKILKNYVETNCDEGKNN